MCPLSLKRRNLKGKLLLKHKKLNLVFKKKCLVLTRSADTAVSQTSISSFLAPALKCQPVSSVSVIKQEELPEKPTLLLYNSNYDVACSREQFANMDDSQLLDLFKPDMSFVFSKKGGRTFLYKWLEEYSWLCYSPSVDGAFCLPCVLFGDQFPVKKDKVKRLFSEPMVPLA